MHREKGERPLGDRRIQTLGQIHIVGASGPASSAPFLSLSSGGSVIIDTSPFTLEPAEWVSVLCN